MLKNLIITYFSCFKKAVTDTIEHDGIEHAGYLSFLAILSIFPFLVFFFSAVGWIGEEYLGEEFLRLIITYLPMEASDAIEPRLNEIISGPPQNILTIAILGAIWTASSSVEGLRTILNRAYRVHNPPSYHLRRLLSISQFLILVSVLIIVIFFMVISPLLLDLVHLIFPIEYAENLKENFSFIRYGISFTIWFLIISSIYYFLPNLKQKWRNVFPGALTVVFLWLIISSILSFYLNHFDQFNVIYGSLTSFIVALLFFYLLSMVLIFGAELNYEIEKAIGFNFKVKNDAKKQK